MPCDNLHNALMLRCLKLQNTLAIRRRNLGTTAWSFLNDNMMNLISSLQGIKILDEQTKRTDLARKIAPTYRR